MSIFKNFHFFFFFFFFVSFTQYLLEVMVLLLVFEPQHQKTYIRTCASSEDSDQPARICAD